MQEIEKSKDLLNLYHKNGQGITLIALIITIILLLILAGVGIVALTNRNGILDKAEIAKEETLIKNYHELLQIIWQDVKIGNIEDKASYYETLNKGKEKIEIDNNFNGAKVEIIDDILEITTKEEYIFQIIEDKVEYVGNKEESKGEITVSLTSNKEKDKKVTFIATASKTGGRKLTYILKINEEERQKITTYKTTLMFEEQTNFGETIVANVEIQYDDGKTNKSNDIMIQDYTIANANEFVAFRDSVNAGNTFEGKTVELISDIDLSSVCGQAIGSFTPIGTKEIKFKGIFDGNYNSIDNLYINDGKEILGLFMITDVNTIIRKLKLKNVNISNTINTNNYAVTGSICGDNYGNIEECALESGLVTSKKYGTNENNYLGGIAGNNRKYIKSCYNFTDLNVIRNSTINVRWAIVGGICGINMSGMILDSYNGGNLNQAFESSAGRIAGGGIVGYSIRGTLSNCYNIGNIKYQNASLVQNAGIIGRNGDASCACATIQNSYYLNTKTLLASYNHISNDNYSQNTTNGKTQDEMKEESFASSLGEAFTTDIQNADGSWKYNNGYPILKWQLQNK